MTSLPERTAIAILAAGAGTRFGGDKLAVPCAGRLLGHWAILAALQADAPVALVADSPAPRWTDAFRDRLSIVHNDAAQLGQGTSVAIAARWASQRDRHRLIVMLADMPLVSPATLVALASRSAAQGKSACRYAEGRCGAPACFDARWFDALTSLGPERGAGELLRDLEEGSIISPPDTELSDVDTPADLAGVERFLLKRLQV